MLEGEAPPVAAEPGPDAQAGHFPGYHGLHGACAILNRAASEKSYAFFCVKGLGDLLIQVGSLNRLDPAHRPYLSLIVGRHLVPLLEQLGTPYPISVFDHPDAGAAAFFQVRSRPVCDVVRSALGVRRGLNQALPRSATLVFDDLLWRERFLAFGWPAFGLPVGANLYERYDAFFAQQGWVFEPAGADTTPAGRHLHIFPGARENDRRFSASFLQEMVGLAKLAGLEPAIFTVEGELPELKGADLPLVQMPRTFSATIQAVIGADRVISADSMTAHLAEYYRRPVFVCSRILKHYWLPLSAARTGRHMLFGDGRPSHALTEFLQ